MLAEWDRLGTPDTEDEDWKTYDYLRDQLAKTPARSIDGVIAKARVLDQRLRCNGEAHSILAEDHAWPIIDDLLALEARS